uniref:peroxidase 60-like n=1 Tax=Erigeron canadensis TaxID=72917 RepID=UPI001CB95D70|nr:peroxidase 60-like [Erigeron canadensis]
MANMKLVALAVGFLILNLSGHCYGALQFGFYKGKCRTTDVEDIVRRTVFSKFQSDRSITPALIRMQFHDCFVSGCDASLLLNGTNTERTAPPNLSVRGYNVIDAVKAAIEKVCPGVVSCADIIIMATRDAVSFSGGGRYNVQTGRRDGTVSLAQNTRSLPPPSISVSGAIKAFAAKGLSTTDMIWLLGGHSVGVAHCALFQDRLYNFKNTGKPDPTMDPTLLKTLRLTCVQNATIDRTVNLDQNLQSSRIVDNSYYKQITMRRGILQIDQELALDPLSKSTVAAFASSSDFKARFGQAMVKMGAIQVLTGTKGEIRNSCQVVNQKKVWWIVKDTRRYSGVAQVALNQASKRTKTSSTGEYTSSASDANFGISLDSDNDDIREEQVPTPRPMGRDKAKLKVRQKGKAKVSNDYEAMKLSLIEDITETNRAKKEAIEQFDKKIDKFY